jgi:TfoX/Sxy family transcriptional regulator of competence genes
MKSTSPDLIEFLSTCLAPFPCNLKRMFGGIAFFANGNMFAGAHQDSIFIRLSEKDRKGLMAGHDEVVPFEPMPGKKMKEYVVLPESIYSDRAEFDGWLQKSFCFAALLPQKKKKNRPKKVGRIASKVAR